MEGPKVLAVILNYCSAHLTINLINELKDLDYPNLDILIVDNGSNDDSIDLLSRFANKNPDVVLIKNERNDGYAKGNNVGIRYSILKGYKYSWIVNNDIEISDNKVLSELVRIIESDTKIAGVGPQIIDHGRIIDPYKERPSFWDLTFSARAAQKRRTNISPDFCGYVYRIYGCCMLLKNEIMSQVGLMDDRTFLYYEEEILAERLLRVDKSFYYTSSTNLVHLGSVVVKKKFGKRRSSKKLAIILRSQKLYLDDYRHFNMLERAVCKLFTIIKYYLR